MDEKSEIIKNLLVELAEERKKSAEAEGRAELYKKECERARKELYFLRKVLEEADLKKSKL